MNTVADGTYDVIVVDVETQPNAEKEISAIDTANALASADATTFDHRDAFAIVLELAITSGPSKGDTVRLRTTTQSDPYALLGLPGELRVESGQPFFTPQR